MKIAKATPEDMKACLDLVGLLNTVDDGYYPSTQEEEHTEIFFEPDDPVHLRLFYDKVKALMDQAPGGINRVVWGFGAAMDCGVFDPNLNYLEVNPHLNGEGTVILKGRLAEIRMLEYCWLDRGMFLERNGQTIEIVGLTEEECKTAEKWLGKDVTITIAACETAEAPGPDGITEGTQCGGSYGNMKG